MSVRVLSRPEDIAEAAAVLLAEKINRANKDFHLCLSGGSTPKALFTLLASNAYRESVTWGRVHFWWGDERYVPPTDPQSNEGMARKALLDRLDVAPDHVHPMYRPGGAAEAANFYERQLREFLDPEGFNVVLLGLGPDAHTASLFPGDPSILERDRWVLASSGAAGVKERITLTPPVINGAQEVLFLVAGADKKDPLSHVINEDYQPQKYPAQVISRNARNVVWLVDAAAASGLSHV